VIRDHLLGALLGRLRGRFIQIPRPFGGIGQDRYHMRLDFQQSRPTRRTIAPHRLAAGPEPDRV
jgi:hypothetical protein